jgi:cell division protein FtsB
MPSEKNQPKNFLPIIICLISLVLIFNISREIIRLYRSDERVKEAQQKIEKLKLENWQLKQEKEYRNTQEFLEGQIRDKLLMTKKGETIVILPQGAVEKFASEAAQINKTEEVVPTWRQWLALFW